MKKIIGWIAFLLGLILAVGQTLEQYNNIFFHLAGLGLLYYGLNLIIEEKIRGKASDSKNVN